MLVAVTADGKHMMCHSGMSREQLKLLRKSEQFFCPHCKERVQLKIGTIKMPHFAHLSNSECDRIYSEGESEQHLLGKEQLYEMFQRLRLQVVLEPYIQQLAQRPDLFVTDQDGRQFAIEFQCSPISHDRFHERTEGYVSQNITPIWIFLTPTHKINESYKIQKITISPTLQKAMIRKQYPYPYMITYHPLQQNFTYSSNLLHLYGNTFIAKILTIPLHQQVFPFYEPAPLQQRDYDRYATMYQWSVHQFVKGKYLSNCNGVNNLFFKACYELRFHSQKLPFYVGIPVQNASAIPLFSAEWQVLLLYFCKQYNINVAIISDKQIISFFKTYNLTVSPEAQLAILQYRQFMHNILYSATNHFSLQSYMVNELHSNSNIEKI